MLRFDLLLSITGIDEKLNIWIEIDNRSQFIMYHQMSFQRKNFRTKLNSVEEKPTAFIKIPPSLFQRNSIPVAFEKK